MGRRKRKKVVKVVKRSLPDVYVCPKCGSTAIKVTINRAARQGQISCSVCNIKATVPADPHEEQVDVYCKFSDNFYAPPPASVPTETPSEAIVTEPESKEEITQTSSVPTESHEPAQNSRPTNPEAGSSGDKM